MTLIHLLRHGETSWNSEGNRYCGRTDLPLAKAGERQAVLAAGALANVPLEAIYVSPLLRSRQTGEAIGAAHDVPLVEDSRLIEIDFGGWEGLTSAEIAASDPAGRAAWLHDPSDVRAGRTGETGREASERMEAFLREVASVGPVAIAVVGHNTANRLALVSTLGAPLASYRRLALDNASISLLVSTGDGVRWLRINDVGHLRARPPDDGHA